MKENDKIDIMDGHLIAYINGELNTLEEKQVSEWINASADNLKHFEMIKKAWEVTGVIEPKPVVVNTNLAWENVVGQIKQDQGNIVPMNSAGNKKIYWSVAAMVVVLLGVFSLLQLSGGDPINVTTFAENSTLVDSLSDGSVVTLNANSSIVYPEVFSDEERRINLTGEAFFDIERNEEKPFIIDLPEAAYVKVLGTSFNIKAIEGDSTIEVYVNSGKVEFGKSASKIELTKGEKGILDLKSGQVYKMTEKVIGLKEMYWMEEELRFESIPLDEVMTILNAVFDAEVTLECEGLKTELHHSKHKEESLEVILTTVAATHGLSIEKSEENPKKISLNCNDR